MTIFDLYVEQGSTFSQSLTLTGDYTGKTIDADIRVEDTSLLSVASWVDASTGEFKIEVSATDTATLPVGIGYFDVELIDGATITKVIKGRVYVDGEVTK